MDEDNRKERAIIPEETNRQLFLPAEMISRGLDLAIRIEQKQGIRAVDQALARGEKIIRGYASNVEFLRMPDGKMKYRELTDEREGKSPIYLFLSIEKDGIILSCVPSRQYSFAGIQDNETRFRSLNPLHSLEPVKIPTAALLLFYKIVKKEGDFRFELGPTNWPGYPGAIPTSPQTRDPLSFPREGDAIEIVIVCTHVVRNRGRSEELVSLSPLQKIHFFIIDENGQDDFPVTRALHQTLVEAKERARQVKSG